MRQMLFAIFAIVALAGAVSVVTVNPVAAPSCGRGGCMGD
jgi:hypothetical protein